MSGTRHHYIYKVTTEKLWREAAETGVLRGMPIDDADGYMHFSTAGQLAETLSLHFRGRSGLMVLAVPTESVEASLRWEASRGGRPFPHLYAALSPRVVEWAKPVSVDENGHADLPELA